MISIADLRKASQTDFSKITQALTKSEYSKDEEKDVFKLTKDKAGNGSAVIRFLPKHPDDELPFVTLYSHAFKGPTGRWYIENSRTTIGEADPISEKNRELWSSGHDSDKEIARAQKRKTTYIANVYVVSDSGNPENVGKVMRFKFGKKIYQMIMDKANPTFAEDPPINVFDPFNGADFKLRMRQVEGYANYDTSTFSDPKPIHSDEEELVRIVNEMKPLKEFIAPNAFKSYDELKRKYESVMNGQVASVARAEQVAEQMREEPVAAPKSVGKTKEVEPFVATSTDEDDDDVAAYFAKIAQ
jgi:hypothetical protein